MGSIGLSVLLEKSPYMARMGSMTELSPARVPKGSPELPARTQPRAVPTPSWALPTLLTQHKREPAWVHPQSRVTPPSL